METQQRSQPQFRVAAELVRNGRIGKLHTVKIGLPGDPSGPYAPEMPVPENLNYDMWLGSTPVVPSLKKVCLLSTTPSPTCTLAYRMPSSP
mgnify:CR=1 FL=1